MINFCRIDPIIKTECIVSRSMSCHHACAIPNLRSVQGWTASTHDEEHPAVLTRERLALKLEEVFDRLSPSHVKMKRAVALLELLKVDRMTLSTDPDGVTERQLMMTSSYMDANWFRI